MNIQVISRSKAKRSFLEAISLLYENKLNLGSNKVDLLIYTVANFRNSTGFNGAAYRVDDNTITVALDSRLKTEELVQTLAHEMVHVKQYAKGQLKNKVDKKGRTYQTWLGRRYDAHYYDQPWEIEAFKRERLLANEVAKIIINKGK